MNQTNQIEQAVKDFIKAGDTNDIQLLDRVLHKDYQNVQDPCDSSPTAWRKTP